jgi:iron complex transport system substrate-binding protein
MNIVSLLPSATEICGTLGLQSALTAVSHECDFPPEVTRLPRITRSILGHDLDQAGIDAAVSAAVREGRALYEVDGALLARLAPDLIVTQGLCKVCAVTEETVHSAMGDLPANAPILSLDAKSVAGVLEDIQRLADHAGVPERGVAAVAELKARWQAVVDVGAQRVERPRVAFVEWAEPPFTGGHWVPEQIMAAGGVDVLGSPGVDSKRTTWAAIEAADPDVIVVGCCGFGLADNLVTARALRERSPQLRAVREGRLWAVDANGLYSRPGPRLVDGAEVFVRIFDGAGAVPGLAERA